MKKVLRRILPLLALLVVVLVLTGCAPPTAFADNGGEVAKPPIDLTPIVQALITVLAGIITLKVVPWIKARTTAAQQEALGLITRTLVYAAEQIFRNEKQSGSKKLMYVKSELLKRGYSVDMDLIEATVKELSLETPVIHEAELLTGECEVEIELPDDKVGTKVKE